MKDFGAEPVYFHKGIKPYIECYKIHIEVVMHLYNGRYYEYIVPRSIPYKALYKNKT